MKAPLELKYIGFTWQRKKNQIVTFIGVKGLPFRENL